MGTLGYIEDIEVDLDKIITDLEFENTDYDAELNRYFET